MDRVKCGVCSKELKMTSLRQHVQNVHGDEANLVAYHCPLCDYAPRNQNRMNQHIINVHLGVKSWKCCLLCDYATVESGHLKNHVKSVHLKEEKKKIYTFTHTSARCVMPSSLELSILMYT
jgi:hypothetical protein